MCGGLPEWILAAMETRAIRLGLELRITDRTLTGRISDEGGAGTDFSGWIGLIAAIDSLLETEERSPAGAAEEEGGLA